MSVYLASDDQKAILNSDRSLINIAYSNRREALHTLVLKVKSLWEKGQKIVVIMPTPEDRALFLSWIDELGLQNIVLSLHLLDSVKQTELERIKSDIGNIENLVAPYEDAEIKYTLFKKNVLDFLNQRYDLVENRSWRQILDTYLSIDARCDASNLIRNISISDFEFSNLEYKSIREVVVRAAAMYQTDFEITESQHANHFLNKAIKIPDQLDAVTYQIFTFKEVATNLRNKYHQFYNQQDYKYLQNANLTYSSLMDKITLMRDRLSNVESVHIKSSMFDVFTGGQKQQIILQKQLVESWNELILACTKTLQLPYQPVKSVPKDCNDVLSDISNKLAIWKDNSLNLKGDFLKSINRFNLHDDTLTHLENDLELLINRINESRILSNALEVNTLSISKQIDFIDDLIYQLQLILLKTEKNIHYFQWQSFIESLESNEKEIIKYLRKSDSNEWATIFDRWYFYSWLIKDGHQVLSCNDLHINTMHKLCEYGAAYETNKLVANHNRTLNAVIESIKKNKPDLYKTIFKNKKIEQPILWKYFLAENNEWLSKIFPVIMADCDELEQTSKQNDQHLILFDVKNCNVEILHFFVSVTTFIDENNFDGSADFLLTTSRLGGNIQISQLSSSERLPWMRSITHMLTAIGTLPEVFQMRESVIFSFASKFINQVVLNDLYELGIKHLQTNNSAYDTILGSLLNSEKHIYIITEDMVMDPLRPDNLEFQTYIIDKLQQTGCELLNLDTTQLLQQGLEALTPMLSLIKARQSSGYLENKQAQIEFI